jgi:predicted GNAT superfamily acetyltransferase
VSDAFEIRDVTDLEGCREVVRIEEDVWGRDGEIVPSSLLIASVKRGGILLGAFDGRAIAGFVWSMPAWRDGALTQWSHMMAVRPGARGHDLGARLKLAQRDRAIARGIELIEWTFDPLQARNAALNFVRLGAISTEYIVDAYGAMAGPLTAGTPTDRLVAEWWLRRPHVERRLSSGSLVAKSAELRDAPMAIAIGSNRRPGPVRRDLDTRRVLIPVPADFTTLQQHDAEIAMAWRLAVRDAFVSYFARTYRAVEFLADATGAGAYVLALP